MVRSFLQLRGVRKHAAPGFGVWVIALCGTFGCRSEGNLDEAAGTTEASGTTRRGDGSSSGEVTSDGADTTAASTGDTPTTCDLFTNDCPDGTKCMAFAEVDGDPWTDTACMPLADDPVGLGEACTVEDSPTSGHDDCEVQAICWYVDPETLVGECVAMCTSDGLDPGCGLPCDALCTIGSELAPPLCLEPCDPLAQDCPGERSCVAADTHFVCVRDESGEGGTIGEPCESIAGCDPGLFCLAALAWPGCSGMACCAPACDLEDPTACDAGPDGVECVAWYGERSSPPSTECTPFERIGVCSLP